MLSRFVGFLLLFATVITAVPALAEPLWTRFAPAERVAADATGDYTLRETHGPWLVMAATFNGAGAEQQARELVLELRQRFNLPAYHFQMNFDHRADNPGRGIDNYGQRIQRRYQTTRTEEHAVLVGDFPSVDAAEHRLAQIKHIRPQALEKEFLETSQSLAREREYLRRITGSKSPGPMRKAFMTRNPLLPAEYFQPNTVDDFVAKMNSGVSHSLLDCPGRYTVQIATFRGRATIGSPRTSLRDDVSDDALVEAAEKAHELTVFLRAKGWDAYEFHDRTESLVTVGSFAEAVTNGPGGQKLPIRNIQIILQTFGAAFGTPQDLTPTISSGAPQVDPNSVKQQFVNVFNSEHGQITQGLKPKFIQIVTSANQSNVRVIPLDIHPKVIAAPKKTVSSSYVWNR